MSKIKVRFEILTPAGREHLGTVEVNSVPRCGEKVQPLGRELYEAIDVLHTPVIRDWDAVVVLRGI